MHHALCPLAELEDTDSRGFELDAGENGLVRIFVVQKDGVLAAYRNRCPHTGAPLEWQADQFFDLDNSFIQCAIHGALFRPEDGYCVRGPCAGQSLEPVELAVIDGYLQITLPGPA